MKNLGKALHQYLEQWGTFNWADANCCHFCSGWMKACDLGDPMSNLSWVKTEREAYRLIHEFGGFEATISHFLGRPSATMSQLKIGDLVLLESVAGRGSLGIVCGRHAAFCSTEGVEYLEMTQVLRGWRIQK